MIKIKKIEWYKRVFGESGRKKWRREM